MRATFAAGFLALILPAIALAQTQPAPVAAPAASPAAAASPPAAAAAKRGADITRNEYVERAKRAAEKRFDKMDANHDGVLTADERRAVRARRAEHRTAKSQ